MNDNPVSEIAKSIVSENASEVFEIRNRQLQNFAEWMVKSGLSPLDYELVEERRSDGATIWYFQQKYKTNESDHETQNSLSN